jgi:hypothetical protein
MRHRQKFRTEKWKRDDKHGEGALGGDGKECGPAVVRAKQSGGFNE